MLIEGRCLYTNALVRRGLYFMSENVADGNPGHGVERILLRFHRSICQSGNTQPTAKRRPRFRAVARLGLFLGVAFRRTSEGWQGILPQAQANGTIAGRLT